MSELRRGVYAAGTEGVMLGSFAYRLIYWPEWPWELISLFVLGVGFGWLIEVTVRRMWRAR